jgi:hypothetical protein
VRGRAVSGRQGSDREGVEGVCRRVGELQQIRAARSLRRMAAHRELATVVCGAGISVREPMARRDGPYVPLAPTPHARTIAAARSARDARSSSLTAETAPRSVIVMTWTAVVCVQNFVDARIRNGSMSEASGNGG